MMPMNANATNAHRVPIIAAASLLFLGLGGVVFYGWLRFGSSIVLALDESGLSWCF
ncbi:hypothetical protein [Neorhizobium alkalisoli]|uniref:hypothetical protein n=1 Tax=Neorhizobium alkalisoli TaxID=528178 RepID=UPI001319CD08|nr:hypothetical protein [Neorhizobium alkalisoli]